MNMYPIISSWIGYNNADVGRVIQENLDVDAKLKDLYYRLVDLWWVSYARRTVDLSTWDPASEYINHSLSSVYIIAMLACVVSAKEKKH